MSTLPKKNALGFYEIRLESIGGLGANLAGKMLAETGAIELGFNAANFSSYGSEKKAPPSKPLSASVIPKWRSGTTVRLKSPIWLRFFMKPCTRQLTW